MQKILVLYFYRMELKAFLHSICVKVIKEMYFCGIFMISNNKKFKRIFYKKLLFRKIRFKIYLSITL